MRGRAEAARVFGLVIAVAVLAWLGWLGAEALGQAGWAGLFSFSLPLVAVACLTGLLVAWYSRHPLALTVGIFAGGGLYTLAVLAGPGAILVFGLVPAVWLARLPSRPGRGSA